MGALASLLRRFGWPLVALGWCALAFGVGYARDDVAVAMFVLLVGLPLGLMLGVAFAYRDVPHQFMFGPRPPYTGPHAHLIGQTAVVVGHAEAGLRVRLAGTDWPARLPPFAPRPPFGTSVQVETVADDILIVRPIAPPA